MKLVILAGGLGTRISEETRVQPKPMIRIGGIPLLVHLMRWYASYGVHEFIICAGHYGNQMKEFFYHYRLDLHDITVDFGSQSIHYQSRNQQMEEAIGLSTASFRTVCAAS